MDILVGCCVSLFNTDAPVFEGVPFINSQRYLNPQIQEDTYHHNPKVRKAPLDNKKRADIFNYKLSHSQTEAVEKCPLSLVGSEDSPALRGASTHLHTYRIKQHLTTKKNKMCDFFKITKAYLLRHKLLIRPR